MGIDTSYGYRLSPYTSTYSGHATASSGGASSGVASGSKPVLNPGESAKVSPGRKSSPAECQTCKSRKYVDGSDEADVSFKAPGHIDPAASASTVMAHEMEHVANAYQKQANGEARVISASVSLKMAVCPECGRSYTAGGTTTTQLAYSNEDNPYTKNKKSLDASLTKGANVDLAA